MEIQDEQTVEQKLLQETESLKAELLATVSHELRSPLTSIKGYTETLLRHEMQISHQERHEFLVAIHTESNRLERLIDRFLELSQLEIGAIRIERSPIDVIRLAREAIISAEQRASSQASEQFVFQLTHVSPTFTENEILVNADSRRLSEVLNVLLENATLYSPAGGKIDVVIRPVQSLPFEKKLAFKTKEVTQKNETTGGNAGVQANASSQLVDICVCDNGIGIPAEHIHKIFERFYRVDTRLTREVNGLGLGLTICKHIVELHDGSIWAESCPSGGSAFHVLLPLEKEKHLASALI